MKINFTTEEKKVVKENLQIYKESFKSYRYWHEHWNWLSRNIDCMKPTSESLEVNMIIILGYFNITLFLSYIAIDFIFNEGFAPQPNGFIYKDSGAFNFNYWFI